MAVTHTTKREALIKHISRLEGQLAAAKRELGRDAPDCERVASITCAASRSFAALREGLVRCFLEETGMARVRPRTGNARAFEHLLRIVRS